MHFIHPTTSYNYIEVPKVHIHQSSKRCKQFNLCSLANDDECKSFRI